MGMIGALFVYCFHADQHVLVMSTVKDLKRKDLWRGGSYSSSPEVRNGQPRRKLMAVSKIGGGGRREGERMQERCVFSGQAARPITYVAHC
jgi:hypothetical protein